MRILFSIFIAILLAGCGNLQAVKESKIPNNLLKSNLALSDAQPSKDLVAPRGYHVPGKPIFFQQSSGGSLAVGVLFGPLGVLANAANVNRITKNKGDAGNSSLIFNIDPLSIVKNNIPELSSNSFNNSLKVKPYIYLFENKNGIHTVAYLMIEGKNENSENWFGLYGYYIDQILPSSYLEKNIPQDEFLRYLEKIKSGYLELNEEIKVDFYGSSIHKRDIAWVKSAVVGAPGIGLPGDINKNTKGHLVIRSGGVNNYMLHIFSSSSQYTFDNGPVPRAN